MTMEFKLNEYKASLQQTEQQLQQLSMQQQRLVGAIAALQELASESYTNPTQPSVDGSIETNSSPTEATPD